MNKPRKSKGSGTDPAPIPVLLDPPVTPYPSIENKTTVILPPDLVNYLDRMCIDIRERTGWKVRRTEILRALVVGLKGSGIRALDCRTEAELAEAIKVKLSR